MSRFGAATRSPGAGPGDSGSPLSWTNPASGARYVMGVGQGSARYFLTYFRGALTSNRVQQNIHGWLDHYVGIGGAPVLGCPP